MCLAKPMQITAINTDGLSGVVDAGGAALEVGLDLVPEAKIGDFVLVHAGMAIDVLAPEDAQDILAAYDEFVHTDDALAPDELSRDEQ